MDVFASQLISNRNYLKNWFSGAMELVGPEVRLTEKVRLHGEVLTWDTGFLRLDKFEKIWVFGAGKAAGGLAFAWHTLLGDRICGGIVITARPDRPATGNIRLLTGNHPEPGTDSIASTEELLKLAMNVRAGDLVLFCITGGASAMLCKPAPGITLAEKQLATRRLLVSGKPIGEINAERKRLSDVKGGKLLRFFNGAEVVNCLVSDVPGDDPATIGSGPAIPTEADTDELVSRLIWVARPSDAAKVTGSLAEKDGFRVVIPEEPFSGPVESVAERVFGEIRKYVVDDANLAGKGWNPGDQIHSKISEDRGRGVVLVFHGESQVSIPDRAVGNDSKSGTAPEVPAESAIPPGGRNQHLALLLAEHIRGLPVPVSVLCAGTDGIDGNTSAAGAWCDPQTAGKAVSAGFNPGETLKRFESHALFKQIDDIFVTGPTGNNLMDIVVVLIPHQPSNQVSD